MLSNACEIEIHYKTYGDSDNPSIVLIHGLGAQHSQWPKDFIEGLVNLDLQVIVMDNRDSGRSFYFTNAQTISIEEAVSLKRAGKEVPTPYTLNDMARDVLKLTQSLGIEQFHLLGHSLGGQIAQVFAINYPERLLSLTLMQTTSGEPTLRQAQPEVLAAMFKLMNSKGVEIKDIIDIHLELYQCSNPQGQFDSIQLKAQLEVVYQQTPYYHEGSYRQLLALIASKPRGEALKRCEVNTLIIHGDSDRIIDLAHAKNLQELIPNSKLVILEKMGHGLFFGYTSSVLEAIKSHLTDKELTLARMVKF